MNTLENVGVITSEDLWFYVEELKPEIEYAMHKYLPLAPKFIPTNFNEALNYCVFSGGKRLRPVLTLLGAELVGGERRDVLPSAVAVEFVHTSSLIFDDLPCMDDAPERRGIQSLHQKYGEGLAVLVGLSLLNASYGLVFKNADGNAENALRAHAELVECIGASGMIGGQSVDLTMQNSCLCQSNGDCLHKSAKFESVKNLKTSALMRMALRVGAILCGANDDQLYTLSRFAELLGDAYQTSDDLLDLQEDLQISQATERRANFALEQGFEQAKNRVRQLVGEAKNVLHLEFGASEPANLLCAMADYITERKA